MLDYSDEIIETIGINYSQIKYFAKIFSIFILVLYIMLMDCLTKDNFKNILKSQKKIYFLFLDSESSRLKHSIDIQSFVLHKKNSFSGKRITFKAYKKTGITYLKYIEKHLYRCKCHLKTILSTDNENYLSSKNWNFVN